MTGLLVMLGMAALVGGLIWWVARPPAVSLQMLAAVLMVAIAGYTWQGSPDLPGSPTPPTEGRPRPPTLFQITRTGYTYRFGADGDLLQAAANLHRMGMDDYGAGMIRAGLRLRPNSADLWTGLGDALVQQGGGMMNPAASFALDRALELRPDHPGPWIVLGDSLMREGDYTRAAPIWRSLLARAPKNAPWREEVAVLLAFSESGGRPPGAR